MVAGNAYKSNTSTGLWTLNLRSIHESPNSNLDADVSYWSSSNEHFLHGNGLRWIGKEQSVFDQCSIFWLTGIHFFVGQFLYFLWFTIRFILIDQTTMNKELSKNEYKFWLFNKSRSKFLKWTYINYTASNINKFMQWHVW